MDYRAQGIQHLVRCQLLDRTTRAAVGQMAGLQALRVEHGLHNQPRGGGTLEVALRRPVTWKQVIVRLWVGLRLGDQVETHPMLTAFPSVSGSSRAGGAATVSLVLKDLTVLLDDLLGRHWVVPAGTVVTSMVRQILTSLGIADVQITDSPLTLRSDLVEEPTDTYRRLINDMLEAIAYGAIWTTMRGTFVAQPYVLPGDRPEMFLLENGPRSVRSDQVGSEAADDVPNHFVLTSRGDGEQEALVAEGWNDDPDNEYSTVNQRTIPHTEEVEAADQASLNAQLDRVMAEYRWSARKYSTSWRYFPISPLRQLELGDAGRLVAPDLSVDGMSLEQAINTKVTLESMGWSWQAGEPLSQVNGTLREVRS